MRKILAVFSLLVALAGGFALAQDATLTAPVVRNSEAKYVLVSFACSQLAAEINVNVQDAGSVTVRTQSFAVPDAARPSATVVGFLTAIGTARSGETGTVLRRANFRVLGFLSDNGYLAANTLNP